MNRVVPRFWITYLLPSMRSACYSKNAFVEGINSSADYIVFRFCSIESSLWNDTLGICKNEKWNRTLQNLTNSFGVSKFIRGNIEKNWIDNTMLSANKGCLYRADTMMLMPAKLIAVYANIAQVFDKADTPWTKNGISNLYVSSPGSNGILNFTTIESVVDVSFISNLSLTVCQPTSVTS